jgi:hypothetical protein
LCQRHQSIGRYLGNNDNILLLATPDWWIRDAKTASPMTDGFRPEYHVPSTPLFVQIGVESLTC